MNVPEYREAIHHAESKLRLAIEAAAETFGKEIAIANERFFEDQTDENVPKQEKR